MNATYDIVVYIGRFSPLHKGHVETINKAFNLGKKVIVLVGSSNQARTIKNPWTWRERKNMIEEVFYTKMLPNGGDITERLNIINQDDYLYNDQQWFADVQKKISNISNNGDKIAIIGHIKDDSSYYLNNFPQWDFIPMDNIDGLHGEDIRWSFFNSGIIPACNDFIPEEVFNVLKQFKKTDDYNNLAEEHKFIKNYKSGWNSSPYAPIFTTTDAVVIQSGHVLLVKRKTAPGKGLVAIPGGFLQPTERLIDGMIRELKEETKLKVPIPVLKGSIKAEKTFDAPNRSLRGRTITYAFLIELNGGELPKVKGSDDAEKAFWMPLADALSKPEIFFEDHYSILKYFIGEL